MKKKILIILTIAIQAFTYTITYSQDAREIELKAQEILARVDLVMQYPDGILKGNISHIFPDGKSFNSDLELMALKDNFLFVFKNSKRGEQERILYNLGGEDIWVYNVTNLQLFHKMDVDKFDQIQQTNFSFYDLSNADLQSNYTATITGSSEYKGKQVFILMLKPIFKGAGYGKLTLYVEKSQYIPLRIDYYDQDMVIVKAMTIAQTAEYNNRVFPIRYDMLHIGTGTLTILKFVNHQKKTDFDKDIFRHENLGKSY